tara:strand:- start:17943 stop:18242 length:300 start_codon:yes stop_codon:yes gene_type:complete
VRNLHGKESYKLQEGVDVDQGMPSSNLLGAQVYTADGVEIGVISELQIDPAAGIVRFACITRPERDAVLMPWAAMFRVKHKRGFVLTHRGEELLQQNKG